MYGKKLLCSISAFLSHRVLTISSQNSKYAQKNNYSMKSAQPTGYLYIYLTIQAHFMYKGSICALFQGQSYLITLE